MANEFIARKGLIVSGSTLLSGSLNVTQGITGSLLGTSSYANNADLLDGLNSTVFATTGSNTFVGNQIVSGTANITSNLTVNGNTLFVDAPNNRVGIGTLTPFAPFDLVFTNNSTNPLNSSAQLHAYTNQSVSNNTYTLTAYRTDVGGTELGLFGMQSIDRSALRADFVWLNGPGLSKVERMRIDSSGNVGIGTTSPSQKLDVDGVARIRSVMAVGTDVGSSDAYIDVGVNRSANGYAYIDLVGDTTYTDYGLRLFRNNTGANAASFLVHRGTGELGLETIEAAPITFYTSGTERARITSGGYFKASNDGTYANRTGMFHELRGNVANDVMLYLDNTSATNPYGFTTRLTAASPDNNTQYFASFFDSTTARCVIWSDGDLANHDGVYGTISDEKLKQDIIDAPSQWDDLKAVRFRKYRMKSDVEANEDAPYLLGVVAQEIAQTSPGLVDEHPDKDAEGNDLGTTTKTVKSSILLMKAAVALQEAMARIEALEARLAALEAQ